MTASDIADYPQDQQERQQMPEQAWDQLLGSIPSPNQMGSPEKKAVNDARWPLKALVNGWYDDELNDVDIFSQAHDHVDEIKRLLPDANVTPLVKLIMKVRLAS